MIRRIAATGNHGDKKRVKALRQLALSGRCHYKAEVMAELETVVMLGVPGVKAALPQARSLWAEYDALPISQKRSFYVQNRGELLAESKLNTGRK
jgi:hypothetical protein